MHSVMPTNKRIEEPSNMIEEAWAIGELLGIKDAADRLRISDAEDPTLRQLYQEQAFSGLLADIRKALDEKERSRQNPKIVSIHDEIQGPPLEVVDGVNDEIATELRSRGIEDSLDLALTSTAHLLAVKGLGKSRLAKIRAWLKNPEE